MAPTFWSLARKPKWLAGLAVAILVAVVFSVLMQWQLSRTFNLVGVEVSESEPRPLTELLRPGPMTQNVYDRLATAEVELDPANSYVVANRLQLDQGEQRSGYWLISNSNHEGASLTLALGFSESLEEILQAKQNLKQQSYQVLGYIEPSEPPKSSEQPEVLESLSLAQLVNLYSSSEIVSYPAYLIVQSGIETGLDQISIEIRQQQVEINWLTAFYAIEWAFFALAAFYIWWRLVRDEQIRLSEQG
jgi:surfeit locus 1 family protein